MERQNKPSKAKKSLQVPLNINEYQSISDESAKSDLSMPEIVRRKLRAGAEAEAEMKGIIDKVTALENAGFVLTLRALNGDSVDLKPLSLFLLPATIRVPKRDPQS